MGVSVALTGINAVLFYAPAIFEQAGFGSIKAVMNMLLGADLFLATLAGVWVRKDIMTTCSAILAVVL
jgi:hypothetical protein